MIKYNLLISLLITGIISIGQVNVENVVEFKPYFQEEKKKAISSIEFKVIVRNNSEDAIPDLDVSNRSKFLSFYVNDINNHPISLYNGIESTAEDHLILPNESDEYYLTWLLDDPAPLIEFYGEVITVYWVYQDIASKKVKVSLKELKIVNQ